MTGAEIAEGVLRIGGTVLGIVYLALAAKARMDKETDRLIWYMGLAIWMYMSSQA